jgi:predicted RNase H-like nuclease (RuvC/YqgF family)
LDELTVNGISMRELLASLTDDEYALLRLLLESLLWNKDEQNAKYIKLLQEQHAEQIRGYEEREEQQVYQLDRLQARVRNLEGENEQLKRERDDFEQRLEAAKGKIDEQDRTIANKQEHIDTLRAEIAVGAREAYKVVDDEARNRQKEELADRIKNSRIPCLKMEPVDFKASRFNVSLVDGSVIEIGHLERGKYRIVSEEEAGRFREEWMGKDSGIDTQVGAIDAPALPEVTPPDSFPQEDTAGRTAAELVSTSAGQADTEPVRSVEARLAALEAELIKTQKRVEKLEEVCDIEEAA